MFMSVGLHVPSPSSPPSPQRYRGETPDKDVFEKHIANLSLKLDVYDKILSKQKYLGGDVRQFIS